MAKCKICLFIYLSLLDLFGLTLVNKNYTGGCFKMLNSQDRSAVVYLTHDINFIFIKYKILIQLHSFVTNVTYVDLL